MPVSKQTYTAAAPWSASQLADVFRQAFIDAGLMSDWHDAFVSGSIENRILRIVNASTKTYGTVFYWFMVTSTGVFIHTALGWNATTHVPTGTQYLDYYATTTNATTNHVQLNGTNLSTATNVTLTRYTSTINTAVTWFVLRNGTISRTFLIPSAGFNALPFVDQSKMAFNGVLVASGNTSSGIASVDFYHFGAHLRRTFLGAASSRGTTTSLTRRPSVHRIMAFGNMASNLSSNATGDDFSSASSSAGLVLPVALANTQADLTSDHAPVFTGPTVSPYMAAMPSDFGVVAYYASSSMAVQDRFIVAASSEEWEIMAVAANPATDAGRVMLMARVI